MQAAVWCHKHMQARLQAMIGGGGFKALMSTGGGKGLYAGVWGNLAGAQHRLLCGCIRVAFQSTAVYIRPLFDE